MVLKENMNLKVTIVCTVFCGYRLFQDGFKVTLSRFSKGYNCNGKQERRSETLAAVIYINIQN